MSTGTASILGFAYESPTTQFNVRVGPGTTFDKAAFQAVKGQTNLKILDVQEDIEDTKSDFGRVYQWFRLEFPDGQSGWIRDHVVGIQGDLSIYGYGVVEEETHAYLLVRDMAAAAKAIKTQQMQAVADEKAQKTAEVEAAKAQATQEVEEAKAQATQEAVAASTQTGEDGTAPTQVRELERLVKEQGWVKPTGPATAVVKVSSAARVRSGPSTTFNQAFTIPRLDRATINAVEQTTTGQHFRWYQVDYQGQTGWIREDLVRYEGDTEALGLPWDRYPAPMADNSWWVRDYNTQPYYDMSTWEHHGWDFGAKEGEPIYCGPLGGRVVQINDCQKCTPEAPSTVMQGLGLGDQSVFSDPAWGYGYGTYVVVAYDNDRLPPTTQQKIADMGYPNGVVYVMYAHLQKREVNLGQELDGAAVIGYCGNTGNSEAPHLHLEVRVGPDAAYSTWSTYRSGLSSPILLFSR